MPGDTNFTDDRHSVARDVIRDVTQVHALYTPTDDQQQTRMSDKRRKGVALDRYYSDISSLCLQKIRLQVQFALYYLGKGHCPEFRKIISEAIRSKLKANHNIYAPSLRQKIGSLTLCKFPVRGTLGHIILYLVVSRILSEDVVVH